MERFTCSKCSKSFSLKHNMTRHMLTHENDKYPCRICSKTFHRTDLLSKHQSKCALKAQEGNTCDLCNKSFSQKRSMTRHRKVCIIQQKEKKVRQATLEYKEKLKEGEILEKVLRKCPDTLEEALSSKDKECLKLYQASCETDINTDEVSLKNWQQEVIRLIDTPSNRTIYWIYGEKGNEGKTFIQKYIHKVFGTRRVLKTEINTKKADIAHILSKEFLTCKDIFLFNLLRSDTDAAYGLLENIKDGYLISAKYRSTPLRIKTPNTVIVFSNSLPCVTKLSKDRWIIFEIIGDELRRENNFKYEKKVNHYKSTKHYRQLQTLHNSHWDWD